MSSNHSSEKIVTSLLQLCKNQKEGMVVFGASMLPVLKPGDIITIEKIGSKNICKGQVIVFETGQGKLIIHRVVKVSGNTLITAGDNADELDEPIRICDVMGIVREVEIKKPLSRPVRFFRKVIRKLIKKFFRKSSCC